MVVEITAARRHSSTPRTSFKSLVVPCQGEEGHMRHCTPARGAGGALGGAQGGAVILLVVLSLLTAQTNAAYRPNIVIILADDMGFSDVGFHGSDEIPTPNIDALAYNGIILNQHYVQPLCSPSRAALMTGRYPIHLGMQGLPFLAAERRGLPEGRILPEYLQRLGYVTAGVGKWHLGYYRSDLLPTRRGFDSFMGYYNGFVSYYDYISEFINPLNEEEYWAGFDLRRNETLAWDLQGRYATDVFTEEAVSVIRKHDPRDPLFLYVSHLAVHAGNEGKHLEAPQEYIDRFRHISNPNRRTYAAMVAKMDESVGKVVSALRARNMLDNTIILFMSDNGAPTEGAYANWGSNAPLRGIKETVWEGGVRGAACIWSPLINRRWRVSYELMHITDWLPTLYNAAGGSPLDLPSDLDGVDQWSSLVSDLPSRRSEILINIDEKDRTAAIRQNNWKLVIASGAKPRVNYHLGSTGSPTDPAYNYTAVATSPVGRALATLRWRSTPQYTMSAMRARATVRCSPSYVSTFAAACDPTNSTRPCLFDVEHDPCELNDLADLYPTVARALRRSLVLYRAGLVAQVPLVIDGKEADPARFGGAWSPWADGTPAESPGKQPPGRQDADDWDMTDAAPPAAATDSGDKEDAPASKYY